MKRIYQLFFFLLFTNLVVSQTVLKKQAPDWVENIDFETPISKSTDGAFEYLLLDFQDNIMTKEQYGHFAIHVLNSEGIQEFSDISVSFDPTFQSLTFNTILITRNGEPKNRLQQSKINVYQRETNLERSLYDGSLTAVINLSDVRKGDIIEYSYTIKGFNPINKGNYSATFYQQYTSPVGKIFTKVITDSKKPIYFKALDEAKEPEISTKGSLTAYTWNSNGENYFEYDTNVPYWLNKQKRVSISTFKDWQSVVDLALPLYQKDISTLKLPQDLSKDFLDEEDKILKLLRFVQDDIRYLGFESGIGAYQPNDPTKVLKQRYGDCKDKSLLLVSLLQKNNVEAYPFLVHTETRNSIKRLLPSHNLFNHCVVYFKYKDESYVVDPTMTGQGGDLSRLSLPKYSYGLLIKKGVDGLTEIDEHRIIPKLKVEETITSDSIGGGAFFLIKSTYSGSKADQMRDYFNSNTQESINKEFVNYYSGLYPSITSTQAVRFTDSNRNGKNEVVVEEYYAIDSFWTKDEESGLYTCQTEPMVLESMLSYTNSPQRKMPYYLGEPHEFEQITTISLPEYWNLKKTKTSFDEDSFSYKNEVRSIGKTVEVKHNYTLKKNKLAANEVSSFLKQHEKINNQIVYQLSHTGEASAVSDSASSFNWFSIIATILIIVIGIFFAKKLYEEYNPEPRANSNFREKNIGGWLVLPGIGLVLTPVVMLFQLAQNGYFQAGIWSVFYDASYENATILTLSMGFELIYNTAFLVFTVLLNILYFQKRTSLPKLIIIFYALNVAVPLLQNIFLSPFLPEELASEINNTENYKEIGRSIIGAAIWIPYFLVSERVKDTFCAKYQTNDLPSLANNQ